MAVGVSTTPTFEFGKPSCCFRPARCNPINPGLAQYQPRRERVVIAVPPPQLRQITILDRQGKVERPG